MAQLVVSAAGAAAGFVIGGPTGAQIGWTLGSVIGASFAPAQKQRGPRLEDLKVSGTEYGQPIAYLVGHPRVAGQVWWASDKREIATTTEAGKGGPSVETTTYTYEVDLLLGLSSNQIMGVSRVWSNGKLVWTKRSDSGTTSALSGKSQTSWRRLSVYQGRSDQLPDPTYEAAVGVGNAPAYRGRGTVFLEGVQLGSSGQIPNFTFEVYTEGDEQGRTATTLDTFPYTLGQNGGIPGMSLPSFTQHMRYGVSRIDVYRFTLGLEETEFVGSYTPVVDGFNALWASSDVSGSFLINVGSTTAYWYNDEGAGTLFTLPYNINVGSLLTVFCRRDDVVLIGDWNSGGNKRIYKYSTAGGTHSVMGAALPAQALSITISGDQVYVLEAKGTLAPTAIWELDLATLSLQATLSVPAGMSQYAALMTDDLGTVYCYNGSNDLYRLEGGSTWVLAKNFTGGIAYGQAGTRYSINGGDLWAVAVPGGGNPARIRVVFDSVTLTQPTLRETVDALLARTGADAAVFDTSALAAVSTPVRALTVSQVSTVRAVLEQLAAAYFFEAYNADKLYFVPRGGASAATLPWDDLGAAEGETPDERLPLDVANDTEIAAQVSLTYANDDADYNTATEHSDRLLSDVISTATVQVPLALTAAEAKGIADAMVQDGYAGRLSGTLGLDMRYAKWTPTDVVTLTDEDGSTYRVRIVRREQSGMVVRWEWVSDDANALASAGVTIDDYAPALTVSLPGPTSLALLDMPILRDADNAPGIYAVAKPVSTNASWPGARLMSSSSGGDYTEAGTFTSRGIFGVTTVALTSWTGGHVFDEAGSVTVDVGAGTLSSSTRDAMLNTDANAMLVGAEVIQFRTATLVSTGIYKLTGLLRGRRGTEHAMTGHAAGEDVALLRTAGMLRVGYDAARIGVEATYKAVTMGKTLSSASARSITDAGVALKPFAPRNLRAARVGSTITVTWDRRSRLSYRWPSASALPLGEEAEAYDVDLLDGGAAVVQTTRVTVPSLAFTGASEVARLDVGVELAAASGGTVFGLSLDGTSYADKFLVGQDAAGLTTSQINVGDQITAALAVGSSYYVSAITVNAAAVPATTLTNRVYRVDLTAPTVIAAQRDATALGDSSCLAHDGTDLWITEPASGNLRKLNASTLVSSAAHAVGGTPLGLAHDSGSLYYFDYATGDLVKWNIGTTSETWRVAAGTTYATIIRVVGSLVFVAGDEFAVHATSDGALQYAHDYQRSGLTQFLDFDGDVLAFTYTPGDGYRALRMSASTGAEVELVGIGNGVRLAYVSGDTVYVNEVQGVGVYSAVGYELIPDLTGYSVRVYQISAAVGRGYSTSLTL
jgi:hypothetical protein